MPWAVAAAVVGVGGAVYQSKKAKEAAEIGAGGAETGARLSQQQFETTRNDLSRYRKTGEAANDRIYKLLALGGGTPDFDQFYESPGYQFRLSEGNKAIERAGAGNGVGYLSGAQLKAATRFNQGMASQEFGNFFDRLQGLSDRGQNAAVQTGQFGANSASEQGRYATQEAGFRSGGVVDSTNSITNGIGQLTNVFGQLAQNRQNRQSTYTPSQPTTTYGGTIGNTAMDLEYN